MIDKIKAIFMAIKADNSSKRIIGYNQSRSIGFICDGNQKPIDIIGVDEYLKKDIIDAAQSAYRLSHDHLVDSLKDIKI